MSAEDHEEAPEDEWAEQPATVGPISEPARATFPDEIPVGTVVGGRYEVRGQLGRGGFGIVYDAIHVELHTPVALKVLHRELTGDLTLISRFQQEARTAAAIGHPNIARTFDLGMDANGAYIAMEKLEGEELADRIARDHPLSEALVSRIGAEVADAMAAAHEKGVIHRDLKPQNIFITNEGRRKDVPKVIDFGIAKLLHSVDGDLTATGQLFGTPRFMAPEQLRGAKGVGAQVDIYAIGAILYRALTGAYPFDGATYPELLLQIMSDEPEQIALWRPDVTPRFTEIVGRAMAKKLEDRIGSARELADMLFEHAETAPTTVPSNIPRVPQRVTASMSTGGLGTALEPPPLEATVPMQGRPWLLPLVAALTAALVGGVIAFLAWPEQDAITEVAEPVAQDPVPDTPEPTETREEPEPVDDPAPPRAEPTMVHFESDPPGAQIRVAGMVTCVAPCDARIAELPAVVTAELEGYNTAERYLPDPAPASVILNLAERRDPGPTETPTQRRNGTRSRPPNPPSHGPDPPPILQR